ncbi:NAD(P)H-hydrate dehydratase [Thiobacter aerophilum]|uniref:Bifunctional NAD(P)H-hydrate repair enzyme n=1 Tax=Thiobacter aerophilum TaxID=3121275 RepID=A0ABV0EAS4_9BURK
MSHPLPIYPAAGIREIERAVPIGPDSPSLMERAGLACAELARTLATDPRPILVLAGPGNNGGDALVAARWLKQWFYRVEVVSRADEARLPPDAATALAAWRAVGGSCQPDLPEKRDWGLVIDGLFGIGLTRPLDAPYADWVQRVNALAVPILALDVPSGLDADTGCSHGVAIRAQHTVTFLALKPGLLTANGPDHCGQLHLRTLDVLAPMYHPASGWLLDEHLVRGLLPPRPLNSHKGLFGSVGILGGAAGMTGAALLAGRAALHVGAGRVYLGLLDDDAPAVDPLQPELMLRPAGHLLDAPHLNVLVAGPGLGRSAAAVGYLQHVLAADAPLVLDADALNLIAASDALKARIAQRKAPTLMTPHPAEAARLVGASIGDVLCQRVEIASLIAVRFNAFVALKGVGTVCAMPNATWFINASGNPGLASPGTGDVLAGILGALLAQGLSPRDALLLGVYLHGAAADRLRERGIGPVGMTASEVIGAARDLLNEWVYGLSR